MERAVHELGWKRYLIGAGLKESQWRNATFKTKNSLAYAFGRATADMPKGRYFDVDCATTRLGLDLAPGIGQREAAGLLVLNGPVVLEAIARADHESEAVFFCVAEGENTKGKHYYNCFAGQLSAFANLIVGEDEAPSRMTFVNVKRVLATVRANAAAEGIDLSDPFLPPLDDPLYVELVKAGREFSDELLTKVRARLRSALAGTGARH